MSKLWEKCGKFEVVVDKFVWLVGLVGESSGFTRVFGGFCGKFCWGFKCGCSLLCGFCGGFEYRTTATNINLIKRK